MSTPTSPVRVQLTAVVVRVDGDLYAPCTAAAGGGDHDHDEIQAFLLLVYSYFEKVSKSELPSRSRACFNFQIQVP